MTKYIDVADTAKIIRKQLKANFPGTKFSVTSKRYSGGSSIAISWQDGAALTEVKKAIAPFEGTSFDWDRDLEVLHKTKWDEQEVCFAHYISCNRSTSLEFVERVYAYCQDRFSQADRLKIVGSENDSRFDVDNYYEDEGLMIKANQILKDSPGDRVFDWGKEKAETEANKQKQQEIIDQQIARDNEYLALQKIPNSYRRAIGTKIDGYKVIDAKIRFQSGNIYHFVDGVLQYGLYGEFGDIPLYENRPTIPVLTVKGESTGHQTEWSLEDLERRLDPIKPIAITPINIRIKGKFAASNKNDRLSDYYKECAKAEYTSEKESPNWYLEDCEVVEKIELTPKHYDLFINGLLSFYDFLEGKGGTYSDCEELPQDKEFCEFNEEQIELFRKTSYNRCVAIVADGRETILIDPQGYSYARYVALVDQSINQELQPLIQHKEQKEVLQDVEINSQVEEIYKTWVQELIATNRLTEILDYQSWFNGNGQSILESLYQQFLERCLSQNNLNAIVSFEDWKVSSN